MDHYLAQSLMSADHATVALFIRPDLWMKFAVQYYPNPWVRDLSMQHIWLGAPGRK